MPRRSYGPPAPSLLLMTATITPPAGVPALSRTHPGRRMADYMEALSFYLTLPDTAVDRIVVAENSATDLGPLQDLVDRADTAKRVELVSFDGLDYPVEHGRAVGEMRLIETALARSRLLGELPAAERFWKVTGRLRVTNLARLVRSAPADGELYADFRHHPRPWVDLRVFACTPAAFRALLLSRVELLRHDETQRAGYSAPEERLSGELLADPSFSIVPRLKVEPRIEGYSGHDDDLGRPARRAWSLARAVVRRVAPRLWI